VVQEEVDHHMKVLVVVVLNVLINSKDQVHLQQMNQHHLIKVENLGVLKQEEVVVVAEVDQDAVILKAAVEASKEAVELAVEVVVPAVDVETSIIEIQKKVLNKRIVVGNKVLSK
jgi:hypothetical protein